VEKLIEALSELKRLFRDVDSDVSSKKKKKNTHSNKTIVDLKLEYIAKLNSADHLFLIELDEECLSS